MRRILLALPFLAAAPAVLASGPGTPPIRFEEILLTRRGGEVAVFDRVVPVHGGVLAWPLLGRPVDLVERGGRVLRAGEGEVVLSAEGAFTLSYRLRVPEGTWSLVRRTPNAIESLVVFLGSGLRGTGTASPRPRAIAPVRVGGVRLFAFSFGSIARGTAWRWQIVVGSPGAWLASALEALAALVVALGGFLAWRRLRIAARR